MAVWDTTTDIRVAAFYCLIVDRRHERAHTGDGAGTHPSRSVALLRALTEAIQVRTTFITGSRDDLPPVHFTPPIDSTQAATRPSSDGGRRTQPGLSAQLPAGNWKPVGDDLTWILARLQSVGVEEVIAVDLTWPELGIPVARVVVPGARRT